MHAYFACINSLDGQKGITSGNSRSKFIKGSVSRRKLSQYTMYDRFESQVDPIFQLLSSCDCAWPGVKCRTTLCWRCIKNELIFLIPWLKRYNIKYLAKTTGSRFYNYTYFKPWKVLNHLKIRYTVVSQSNFYFLQILHSTLSTLAHVAAVPNIVYLAKML